MIKAVKKRTDLEIVNLKKELEKTIREKDEYKNKYLRALADYQNFEKRVKSESEWLKQKGKEEIIIKLFPFLDNLEKAEIFIKDDGLKQIKNSFYQILKEEKIEEIEVIGKTFDPHLAEAVEVVEGEKDNVVVEVVRKGYRRGEKILRVAQVKVSKKQVK